MFERWKAYKLWYAYHCISNIAIKLHTIFGYLVVIIHSLNILSGYFGIEQQECEAKGCCWSPKDVSYIPTVLLSLSKHQT